MDKNNIIIIGRCACGCGTVRAGTLTTDRPSEDFRDSVMSMLLDGMKVEAAPGNARIALGHCQYPGFDAGYLREKHGEFSSEMLRRLACAHKEGKGGWNLPENYEYLRDRLATIVAKLKDLSLDEAASEIRAQDFVNLANFALFLWFQTGMRSAKKSSERDRA